MKKSFLSLALFCLFASILPAQTLDNLKFEFGLGEKKKGYYNTTQIGLIMGNKEVSGSVWSYYYYSNYYVNPAANTMPDNMYSGLMRQEPSKTELKITPSITMVNGYMFNEHWSAGIGLGVEIFEYTTFPVFAEVKYVLWDKKISPYFTFKGGYSIADLGSKHYDEKKTFDFYPYEIYGGYIQNFGGLMINPEIGMQVKLSRNAGLLISAGYRHQELKSKASLDNRYYDSYCTITEGGCYLPINSWDNKQYLNRLVFGLAVLFK